MTEARIDTLLKNYLPSGEMPGDAHEVVEESRRADWVQIVAALIRLVGDFEIAEEAAQEAFTAFSQSQQ